jgi:hypothetical protein
LHVFKKTIHVMNSVVGASKSPPTTDSVYTAGQCALGANHKQSDTRALPSMYVFEEQLNCHCMTWSPVAEHCACDERI